MAQKRSEYCKDFREEKGLEAEGGGVFLPSRVRVEGQGCERTWLVATGNYRRVSSRKVEVPTVLRAHPG